jgi:hypothetical protein
LETTVTEPAKKPRAQRNTKELPISVAVETIRRLDDEQRLETDTAIRAVGMKISRKYDGRRLSVLNRIPEDFTEHVLAKARGEQPSRSADVQSAPTDETSEPPIPKALRDPVPPPKPGERIAVERS